MSKLTKAQAMDKLKALIGDKNDDDTLNLIGDFSDTLDGIGNDNTAELAKANERIATLEKEKKDLDTEWRTKFRDRFFGGTNDAQQENPAPNTENKPLTYDNLFKEDKK